LGTITPDVVMKPVGCWNVDCTDICAVGGSEIRAVGQVESLEEQLQAGTVVELEESGEARIQLEELSARIIYMGKPLADSGPDGFQALARRSPSCATCHM
jgi:hypothetical protein